jgi:hypothetical protein
LRVFGVTNHVHVQDAMLVEPINNGLGGNTDGGDEELSAALDDDIDEFVELSLCVVVAMKRGLSADVPCIRRPPTPPESLLGLARASTDLGK